MVESKIPDVVQISSTPHMPGAQIDLLRSLLEQSRGFLEFGAGGSSMLALESNVPWIASVESDRQFASEVTRQVTARNPVAKFNMYHIDIGETGNWGKAKNNDAVLNWPKYSLDVWDDLRSKKMSPDLILIDGRFRVACMLSSLIFARPGTTILLDDYIGRTKQFIPVLKFLEPERIVERMAVFVVPEKINKTRMALDLARRVVDQA